MHEIKLYDAVTQTLLVIIFTGTGKHIDRTEDSFYYPDAYSRAKKIDISGKDERTRQRSKKYESLEKPAQIVHRLIRFFCFEL